MNSKQLCDLTVMALGDIKAIDVKVLDVTGRSSVTDIMVIATGNTTRQVKSLSNNVLKVTKENDIRPIGVEGEQAADWILIDLGDVVVHVMTPDIRDFYNLEKLWDKDSPLGEESLDDQGNLEAASE